LGCALEALDLLLCRGREEAGRIAKQLALRNDERRSIEEEVYREARALAGEQLRHQDRSVLALASQGWHRGILGIVASRLAREFQRTVVLVSFEGDQGKGSVRSADNLAFLDELLTCRHLLEDVGGHQMAAGISLKQESLADFHDAFEREVAKKAGRPDQTHPPLLLDTWLEDFEELTGRTMDEIERMAPFGHGNPEPLIGMRQMRTLNKRRVGGSHLKMTLERDGRRFDAIGFDLGRAEIIENEHPVWDVVCAPRREYWDGRYRLSLRVVDLQPS
jgi:single-stranded-DNA-specific exonuclease